MRGILRRLIGCRQSFISSSSSGRSSELGQTLMVSSAATVSYSAVTLMEKPNLISGFPVAATLLPDFHPLNHYRNFSTPSSSGPPNIVSIESEEQFNTLLRKVQDESLPAIFYFTAVWCGPCRLLSPVIGQLSEKYPHVTTYKVDIDKDSCHLPPLTGTK